MHRPGHVRHEVKGVGPDLNPAAFDMSGYNKLTWSSGSERRFMEKVDFLDVCSNLEMTASLCLGKKPSRQFFPARFRCLWFKCTVPAVLVLYCTGSGGGTVPVALVTLNTSFSVHNCKGYVMAYR